MLAWPNMDYTNEPSALQSSHYTALANVGWTRVACRVSHCHMIAVDVLHMARQNRFQLHDTKN